MDFNPNNVYDVKTSSYIEIEKFLKDNKIKFESAAYKKNNIHKGYFYINTKDKFIRVTPVTGPWTAFSEELINSGGASGSFKYYFNYSFEVLKTYVYSPWDSKKEGKRYFSGSYFKTRTLDGCCGVLNVYSNVNSFFSLFTLDEQILLLEFFFTKYAAVMFVGNPESFPADFINNELTELLANNPKSDEDIHRLTVTKNNYKDFFNKKYDLKDIYDYYDEDEYEEDYYD